MQLSGPAAPVSEAVTPSAAAGNIQSMNAHTAALAILASGMSLTTGWQSATAANSATAECLLPSLEVRSAGTGDSDVSHGDGPAYREVLATAGPSA